MGKLHIVAFYLFGLTAAPVTAQQVNKLCPTRIATLNRFGGDPTDTESGPRVEIRTCPVESSKGGNLQLAAWKAATKEPALIFDAISGSVLQLSMIWGVYAFELSVGRATALVVIEFTNGEPHLAVEQYVRDGEYTFTSDAKRLLVQWTDSKGVRNQREFLPDKTP